MTIDEAIIYVGAVLVAIVTAIPDQPPTKDVQIRRCMAAGQIFNPRCADEYLCRKPARREM